MNRMPFEVRTTGDDNNGGGFNVAGSSPGTDYSQQDAAQVSYTDLVIDGADNAKVTSTGNPFTAAHNRNVIHITGGTGFTTGWYEVVAVTAGVATLDRGCGTNGSTGGTGKLGGALASVGQVVAIINSAIGDVCTVHVKAGTYAMSNSPNVSGGRVHTDKVLIIGYNTTRNDWGVGPTFQASTTGFTFTMFVDAYNGISNVIIDGNSQSGVSGCYGCVIDSVEIKNCGTYGAAETRGMNSIAHHNGGNGFHGNGRSYYNCVSHNNAGSGFTNVALAARCIAYGNANHGFDNVQLCAECSAYNNGGSGSQAGFFLGGSQVESCIAYGNLNNFHCDGNKGTVIRKCASGGATNLDQTANIGTYARVIDHVTLTTDPFTNAASADFSLNSAVGGGAACAGSGLPSGQDIGAVQTSVDPAPPTGSGGSLPFIG